MMESAQAIPEVVAGEADEEDEEALEVIPEVVACKADEADEEASEERPRTAGSADSLCVTECDEVGDGPKVLDTTLLLEEEGDGDGQTSKPSRSDNGSIEDYEPVLSLVSLNPRAAPTFDIARGPCMEVQPDLAGPTKTVQISCGRDARNAIVLFDQRVSLRHFVVRVRAQAAGVRERAQPAGARKCSDGERQGCAVALDLLDTSSNGTWVNGQKVGRGKRVALAVGDRVTVLPTSQVGRESSMAYMLLHDTRGARCFKAVADVGVGVVDAAPVDTASQQVDPSPPPAPAAAPLPLALERDLRCGICADVLYKCLTLVPCGHNFCMACLARWRRSSPSCPECRASVRQAVRNMAVDCMVETFVKAHPSLARASQELRAMDMAEKERENKAVLAWLLRDMAECGTADAKSSRASNNRVESVPTPSRSRQQRPNSQGSATTGDVPRQWTRAAATAQAATATNANANSVANANAPSSACVIS